MGINTDRFGNPLGGYRFNGIKGGSVDIPQPVSINNTDFTFNTWIKITQGAGMEDIFTQYENNYHAFELDVTAAGNLTLYDNFSTYFTGTQAVSSGVWHMVTCVYTVADGTIKFYVDGIPDTMSYNINLGPITETDDITIGFGHDTPFNGCIDDLREYNRALSNSEIRQLYGAMN